MKHRLVRDCHERFLQDLLSLSAARLNTQGSLFVANERFVKNPAFENDVLCLEMVRCGCYKSLRTQTLLLMYF